MVLVFMVERQVGMTGSKVSTKVKELGDYSGKVAGCFIGW